jgi:hypothetical protein
LVLFFVNWFVTGKEGKADEPAVRQRLVGWVPFVASARRDEATAAVLGSWVSTA